MRTRDFSRAPAQARAGAMFIGGTRYASPLVLLRLAPDWFRMVRDMRRMSGYRWHTVYWQFPLTLGTIAFFADRDAMLRFARTRHHRKLMAWLTDGNRNATAGFIRLYTADPDGYSNGAWRAEDGAMGHIEEFTPLGAETTGPAVRR
ncbi:DUF4188 domain-containing protein [Micromonospora sp. WMMD1128]|uniref:DUF4188 domain-containing protein n=1 Tax=unclassified Micromonospora TaxID=2617518 RepID=UPI00248C708D|nr:MULTISPECIES: DUF4188 domain-containing protein [unclassified Micromonospora]WBB71260.1 DUF4188 domain-containing protein [Micromonospora sp. WMMD1128]WFE35265.1 DUF4188 domain-containing protein [Micromonospora sp. WMMD975]